MTQHDHMSVQWRKSSHSAQNIDSDCVELGDLTTAIGIRDSKNPDAGHLSVSRLGLAALLSGIKS